MKQSLARFFAALLFFSAAILTVTSLSEVKTSAQWRNRDNRIAKADVDGIIRNVEQRTDVFVKQFNKALDNSRLNGTRREDHLDQRARDLAAATDELRRQFDRRDRWDENRDQVGKCLDIATDINAAMRNHRFNGPTQDNWANVRGELNELARVYELPRIGGAYR